MTINVAYKLLKIIVDRKFVHHMRQVIANENYLID